MYRTINRKQRSVEGVSDSYAEVIPIYTGYEISYALSKVRADGFPFDRGHRIVDSFNKRINPLSQFRAKVAPIECFQRRANQLYSSFETLTQSITKQFPIYSIDKAIQALHQLCAKVFPIDPRQE